MDKIKELWESFDGATRKALCIALSVIMLFGTGNFVGSLTNITVITDSAPVSGEAQQTVQVDATAQTTAPSVADTTAPAEAQTTAPTATQSAPAQTGAYSTPEEIVALFNEASNKVKTEATKVVKNFEKRNFDDTQSIIPAGLDSLASSLMNQYLGDDTDPIEYASNQDIIANYPVPEQTYSSQLTAADVAEATCTDNGTEYEITLKLNTSENPSSGVGVGAACDVIESSQVTSNGAVAKILKEFTISYYDCVIKCKIDKATKRVTWSNYVTPLTIDALVSVLVTTVDAKVVLSFEKDYTVTY